MTTRNCNEAGRASGRASRGRHDVNRRMMLRQRNGQRPTSTLLRAQGRRVTRRLRGTSKGRQTRGNLRCTLNSGQTTGRTITNTSRARGHGLAAAHHSKRTGHIISRSRYSGNRGTGRRRNNSTSMINRLRRTTRFLLTMRRTHISITIVHSLLRINILLRLLNHTFSLKQVIRLGYGQDQRQVLTVRHTRNNINITQRLTHVLNRHIILILVNRKLSIVPHLGLNLGDLGVNLVNIVTGRHISSGLVLSNTSRKIRRHKTRSRRTSSGRQGRSHSSNTRQNDPIARRIASYLFRKMTRID